MGNNKVYIPLDCISRHADFDVVYADGDLFMHCTGEWKDETSEVKIMGPMGGELGSIKPDYYTLDYYLRMEMYNYVFECRHIFKHYFIKGMLWTAWGGLEDNTLDFIKERKKELGDKKEVHVRKTTLPHLGDCYEVKVTDVSKMRVAAASVLCIAIKEYYKGKSEGEPKKMGRLAKAKNMVFGGKGKTYEEILAEEAEEAATEAAKAANE